MICSFVKYTHYRINIYFSKNKHEIFELFRKMSGEPYDNNNWTLQIHTSSEAGELRRDGLTMVPPGTQAI